MSRSSTRNASLTLAPHVTWTRSAVGGEDAFVYSNEIAGGYFATDEATHRFLQAIDRGLTVEEAVAACGGEPARVLQTIPALLKSGLVISRGSGRPGDLDERMPARPIEARLLFALYEICEIGWLAGPFRPLSQALFSKAGAAAFVVLALVAANGLVANATTLSANFSDITFLDVPTLMWLSVIFLALKALHELGHALATAHFLEAEGRGRPRIRAGIALFFLMPLPFTNTTAAWQLASKWRRAAIGAAGMYAEAWVAVLAAIAWAQVGEGQLQMALVQVVLVAGVSTLFFNLNPLVRLDGYYILTDIIDQPNLATRASRTACAVGHRLLGLKTPLGPDAAVLSAYWVLAFAYRAMTMSLIVVAALMFSPVLAAVAAALAVLILVVRPAIATVKSALQRPDADRRTSTLIVRAGAMAAAAAALFLVPVPNPLILEGRIVFDGRTPVYPEVGGFVRIAPAARRVDGETTVIEIINPELVLESRMAEAALGVRRIELAEALKSAPERLPSVVPQLDAARAEFDEVQRKIATATIKAEDGVRWHPAAGAAFDGAWIEPRRIQMLGAMYVTGGARLVAVLDQARSDGAAHALVGATGRMRLSGQTDATYPVYVRSVQAVAVAAHAGGRSDGGGLPPEAGFDVTLAFKDENRPEMLLDGKLFDARIERPARPLWAILLTEFERLSQKRFRLS